MRVAHGAAADIIATSQPEIRDKIDPFMDACIFTTISIYGCIFVLQGVCQNLT